MYANKPRLISSIIQLVILLGLGVYHVYAVGQLREDMRKSDEEIEKLKQSQISYSAENKALSEELEELRETYLHELEKTKDYEEEVNSLKEELEKKNSEVEQLNKDLQAKLERKKKEDDKSVILSKNNPSNSEQNVVTTSSSSSKANNTLLGTFDVTYYSAYDGTQIGITRGGTDMSNGNIYTSDGYRVIAVDPNTIPFGSIVRVTTTHGESFLAKADDTGGMIQGNRIDIAVSSPDTAYSLGRGTATVELVN